MSRKLSDLNPILIQAWVQASIKWADNNPSLPRPFITCTHRSNEEQEILYMNSRNGLDDDGDGRIDEADEWRSNARPGESKHNKFPSDAFDIAFKKADGKLDWSEALFAKFATIILGIDSRVIWGGNWKKKDTPHFEL